MREEEEKARKKPGSPVAKSQPCPLVLDSKDLLQGRPEIQIEHDGQTYRLRVTRTGKLILHK